MLQAKAKGTKNTGVNISLCTHDTVLLFINHINSVQWDSKIGTRGHFFNVPMTFCRL